MRLQIGGFCIKGGGHVWTYEEGADGCSGWDVFIEVEPEDVHLFPDWVQNLYYQTDDYRQAVYPYPGVRSQDETE